MLKREVLEDQVKQLGKILSEKPPEDLGEGFKCTLRGLAYELQNQELSLEVHVKLRSKVCLRCQKCIRKRDLHEGNFAGLPCEENHLFCSDNCLKRTILDMCNGDLLEARNSLCPKCYQQIPIEVIHTAFGGQEEFSKQLKEFEESREPILVCGICGESKKINLFLTLGCDHRFCRDCFIQMTELYITEGRVDEEEMACPDCKDPIHQNILQGNLPRDTYEKFTEFRFRNWKPEDENVLYFDCLTPDCPFRKILPLGMEKYTCDACEVEWCLSCMEKNHDDYGSCEDYAKWKLENEKGDAALAELAQQEGWMKCPKCNSMCEKIKGCKFMTCESQICKRKTYFCYLCGRELTQKFHYSHFYGKPFGEQCKGQKGEEDE